MSATLKDRRIGLFRISIDLINSDPEGVRVVMAEVIVVKAEFDAVRERVEYTAICDDFAPVRPADAIPYYTAEMHKGADGRPRVMGWSGGSL